MVNVSYKGDRIMKNKGFTAIELMIVICIVGVLAAIFIPWFTGEAHGAELNLPLAPTVSNLEDVAATIANDPTRLITVMVYSENWSADDVGYKKIESFLDDMDRVMDALVRLGVQSGRINMLLANLGGLEFTNSSIPEKDGVYVILE
jgi:prepilin-type N-terminal cleavage/methylation domain-containing protein